MRYATFSIGDKRYENYPITDTDIKTTGVIIQIDGDKHLFIPISRCEYILEISRGELPKGFDLDSYLDEWYYESRPRCMVREKTPWCVA